MRFLLLICLWGVSHPICATETYYLTHGTAPVHQENDILSYVNPDAPKGGHITMATLGTYDSLNPYIIKGTAAVGLLKLGSFFFYESLMDSPLDDALGTYCHIAETVDRADDNTYVIFKIRKGITFHDGSPLTVDDVIFSFNILMKKGDPFIKAYYKDIHPPLKIDQTRVKFTFKNPNNKELAVILGQLPVLCKAFWEKRDFENTLLTPPPSTGPYMIAEVKPGHSITYERNPNYWAKDLPRTKGRWNFDKITFEYYRDSTLTLQAFLGGDADFRQEVKPLDWFTSYNGPTFKSGFHVKEEIKHETPPGGYGLYFNLRRPQLQDIRVRQALSYLYDFEWINKNMFEGKFTRTRSYFQNTELAATGTPQGEELELLNEYRDQLPPLLFTQEFNPPRTSGSGNIRPEIRKALALFKAAGYVTEEGKLVNGQTKEQLEIEILTIDPYHQRIFMPFIANMQKLGIEGRIRIVDAAQYQSRMNNFDFDMTNPQPGITWSPGNEQLDYWGSKQADMPGSNNCAGVKSPIVDALIQKIINAPGRSELVAASRALDRVLQWQFISIPLYHNSYYWVAYKNRFARAKTSPKFGLAFYDAWWIDPEKDKVFQEKFSQEFKAEGA